MAEAVRDESDDEFSRALQCSVHFGVIKQPKDLPCPHTFCKDCLAPLVENNQIRCPICQEVCKLPARGVDGLRNNIALQNILDTLCVSCQKTQKRSTCPCCQQKLCDECKIQHFSKRQTRITDKKQELKNMASVLTKTGQSFGQNRTKFLSQVAKANAEIKISINKVIEHLKSRQTQLEAELNSIIKTETERINKCLENIQKLQQEIQLALQRPDGPDNDIMENLERLSADITSELSTMVISPATVSFSLGEQLTKLLCMGFGQIEYNPPQPGPSAHTALLWYQPVSIDYQSIGSPRKVFGQGGSGLGQFDCPTCLAVCPISRNLVICDAGNNRVQICTADGKFLRMFGSKGEGDGQFDFVVYCHSGVTVTDRGEIVIADTGNHRLQMFDEAGQFLRKIGSKGTFPGNFNCPTGVACDHSDHLYICDWHNQRVQVMSMDGCVVRVITSSGVPGGHWLPEDIAVCPDGDLIVADSGRGIQVLNVTGQHKATIPFGEGQDVECRYPVSVAVDPQGHILITDGDYAGTHRVYVMEKGGKLVCSFGGEGTYPGQFDLPISVAVTQDGNIIVVDFGNDRMQIF